MRNKKNNKIIITLKIEKNYNFIKKNNILNIFFNKFLKILLNKHKNLKNSHL